jgi:hypothetical protein
VFRLTLMFRDVPETVRGSYVLLLIATFLISLMVICCSLWTGGTRQLHGLDCRRNRERMLKKIADERWKPGTSDVNCAFLRGSSFCPNEEKILLETTKHQ